MTATVDSSPRPLSGWGRTMPTTALVSRPSDVPSVLASMCDNSGGIIARGMGRSYGDAAQCSGGLTIDATGLGHIGSAGRDRRDGRGRWGRHSARPDAAPHTRSVGSWR